MLRLAYVGGAMSALTGVLTRPYCIIYKLAGSTVLAR
jgi:hypothetical protein